MRKPLALLFSLFGLFDSAYLWWVYASPTHPLVCLGTGCDEVRASRFAFWGGIPTPAFGAVMYAALVLLLLAEPFAMPAASALLRKIAFGISAAGMVVSLYLTSLEAFQIHAWCAWCVAQQIAIAIVFALLAVEVSRPVAEDPPQAHRTALQNVLVFVIALVVAVPAFSLLKHHADAQMQAALQPESKTKADDLSHLIEPGSHATGPADAPVTVVEFGDFQCPSCIVAETTNHEIRTRFPKQVRFIFREYPLSKFHKFAEKAAEAAECAGDQDKFWPMHDRMYASDGELAVVQLKYYAQDIGLDAAKFTACLDGGEKAKQIEQDMADGKAAGVTATPTFFINQQKHVGGLNLQEFTTTLTEAQSKTPQPASQPEPVTHPKPQATDRLPSNPRPTSVEKPQTAHLTDTSTNAAVIPGISPAPNPLAIGQGDSGDCDVNGTKPSSKNEIATTTAEQMLKNGAVFVDIRQPGDFAKAHIPGAVNLPLSKLSDGVAGLPKGKPVVVYESGLSAGDVCASSRAAAGLLSGRGFKDVKVYHDGFVAWQHAGAPVQ